MVKHRALLFSLVCAVVWLAGGMQASAQAPLDEAEARAIVERADAIRFPKNDFQVDVVVSSRSGSETLEPRRYRILSKGTDSTIVQTLEPPVERGQNMLMRDRELWVYMPTVSQPIRLSLSQRLTGQVANGDLARANFAGDYTPRYLRREAVDGVEHHVLELNAAVRGVTYPKVVYWVRADNGRPHKAEFHAVSGRLLKTCTYEGFETLGNEVRPTRLVMTDAVREDEVSVLEYSELKSVELPDRMFTKDYMKRLD
jgi:outer membrane lipoprotein-sorting protein